MPLRSLSRIRPRSGVIETTLPGMSVVGTGTANHPTFSGSILSLMPGMVVSASGLYTSSGDEWYDVMTNMTGARSELAIPGRRVAIDLDGGPTDYGAYVDDINGASVTQMAGGAFDGTTSIRIRPPAGSISNPRQTYSCICAGLNLSNSGSTNVAQSQLGFCIRYGAQYWNLAATAKLTGFLGSLTQGGATSSSARTAIFEHYIGAPSDRRRVFCVTAATVQSYHQPISGVFTDSGPNTDKLLVVGSTSNHASNPPQIGGNDWMYFHEEVDYRRDRGNPNGRHRLDAWARDGYLGYLEIPLNHDANWNYNYRFIEMFEYLGALWNNPSTAHADNYLDVSHVVFSNNRLPNQRMEPPIGFLQA